jgi:hypothetical protein
MLTVEVSCYCVGVYCSNLNTTLIVPGDELALSRVPARGGRYEEKSVPYRTSRLINAHCPVPTGRRRAKAEDVHFSFLQLTHCSRMARLFLT